ncbi:hypothetical protein ALQ31_00952, partial [Pseudomonas amygdali pv. morsprunorum]
QAALFIARLALVVSSTIVFQRRMHNQAALATSSLVTWRSMSPPRQAKRSLAAATKI